MKTTPNWMPTGIPSSARVLLTARPAGTRVRSRNEERRDEPYFDGSTCARATPKVGADCPGRHSESASGVSHRSEGGRDEPTGRIILPADRCAARFGSVGPPAVLRPAEFQGPPVPLRAYLDATGQHVIGLEELLPDALLAHVPAEHPACGRCWRSVGARTTQGGEQRQRRKVLPLGVPHTPNSPSKAESRHDSNSIPWPPSGWYIQYS